MQRKFLLNLFLLLTLNLIVKPFYIIGIDAEVLDRVRSAGGGEYGIYFSILNFSILLNIILDFGIVNFNTRNLAMHSQLVRKHFSGIFTLRIVLAVIYLVVVGTLGLLVYDSKWLHLIALLAANQVIIAAILYFRSILNGLMFFAIDSIVSVLDRVLLIIICSAMLWGGVFGQEIKIEWFVYAQTFSYSVSAIVAFLFVYPKAGGLRLKLNWPFARLILKKSFPFALLIVLMTVYYRSDSFMLEQMTGVEHAENYAMGYRMFEALNMVVFMFAGMLLPIFARLIKVGGDVQSILVLTVKLLFVGGLVFGIGSYFYQNHLLDYRYKGVVSSEVGNAFGMLLLSFFAICVTFLFSTLLTASGKLRELNMTASIGLVLNVVLNLILIPKYYAFGAALASLVTQSITGVAQMLIVQKHFSFKVNWVLVFKMVGLLLFGLIAGGAFSIYSPFSWYINFIITLIVLTLLSWALRLIEPKSIVQIVRMKEQ